MVQGDHINFEGKIPVQHTSPPNTLPLSQSEKIEEAINCLKTKKVISLCNAEPREFISPIFTLNKKDGNIRLILNLKKLNDSVEYHHFKMDNIYTVLKLVSRDCWMSSLDLKDAYYSVPIHPESQSFLKFYYNGNLYKFQVFPNGLSSCPRRFTKLLKPVLATLRLEGHVIVIYIDDLLVIGTTYEQCVRSVIESFKLLESLGFVIHPEKSSFVPKQCITFLGFKINSVTMTLRLTEEKARKLMDLITKALQSPNNIQIREIARIIGHMVSSFPAVKYGPLYYRNLEHDKTSALKQSKGNYDGHMNISKNSVCELNWWLHNVNTSFNTIEIPPVDAVVYSDASLQGWGAALGEQSTGGGWAQSEKNHINILELKAALFALKSFASEIKEKHVKIMIDNSSAVFIINNMGTSHNDTCNSIALEILEFCIQNQIRLTAAHLPGSWNVVADRESRTLYRDAEWMLNPKDLASALEQLQFQPEIDLFASRLNKQFKNYCSYRPDPEASHIDAFSISWEKLNFYGFPPFSCLLKTLRKIIQERAKGIIVIPNWPTQVWYPLVKPLLLKPPQRLHPSKTLLHLPTNPEEVHPLHKKLEILICLVSGQT